MTTRVTTRNWVLRRNDQVECVLFWPIDELESRGRAEATSSRILPALVALKLAGCIALVVLLVDGLAG